MKHGVKVRMGWSEKRKVYCLFRLSNHFCPDCSPVSIYTEICWIQSKFTYIFILQCWDRSEKKEEKVWYL